MIASDYNLRYNDEITIELYEIPIWIHRNEVDYILNHKRLNEIAQELIILDKKLDENKDPPVDIQERYDTLYAESERILEEIIGKLDNKYLISSNLPDQDICEYLEKTRKRYKSCLSFSQTFIRNLLLVKPFRWYAQYNTDSTICSLVVH